MSHQVLKALSTVAQHEGLAGKVFSIKGIQDMVEEYLGVHRDIFRKDLVKTFAILDGAFLMWQKKQHVTAEKYMNDADSITYDMVTSVDFHYLTMYSLYPSIRKPLNNSITTWSMMINTMYFVIQND